MNMYKISNKECVIQMQSKKLGTVETVISSADFNRVKGFNWYPVLKKKSVYVKANITYFENGTNKKYAIPLHRLILSFPEKLVDHIDGDTLNNRMSNLREATVQENNRNSKARSGNTTGFKGVRLEKGSRKYRAYIKVNSKAVHLGMFDTAEQASAAYDQAALRIFKNFARPNQVNLEII